MSDGAPAQARFRFHGELAAFLAPFRRERAFAHTCARAATLKHAVESLGIPHTEVGSVTVNGERATLARRVREGDVVEVFPWRTPAECSEATPTFVADAHLGGLARLLRMLGFDTLYDNAYADDALLEIAAEERRVILTRDRALLKRREVLRGAFVHARRPEAQLREVARRFDLQRRARPFTLCLHCNLALKPVETAWATARVPDRVAAHYRDFVRCPGCERIFWQGSHWRRMRDMLAETFTSPAPA